MSTANELEREIAAIGALPREDLAREWKRIYRHPPPKSLSHDLLARAVSWHLQAKRLGGLSAGTRQLLKQLMERAKRGGGPKKARGVRKSESPRHDADIIMGTARAAHSAVSPSVALARTGAASKPRRRVSQGARLIRDWNGRAHVVDVIDRGFVYDGKLYSSLTAIAFAITGARWSGPRFFGL
ncbi:DUF2924 domain-containing protein [Mesorhizobium sp. IMUNJ 23232]|uniref:DUF2924 domain-containing protein n=1 Tax=Mesorhizobium sp. IMUNJ 23232 TaxID=3376064 RepID=UPI0037A30368